MTDYFQEFRRVHNVFCEKMSTRPVNSGSVGMDVSWKKEQSNCDRIKDVRNSGLEKT